MRKWQLRASAALLSGAMALGTPISAMAETEKTSVSEEKQEEIVEKANGEEEREDIEDKGESDEKSDLEESGKDKEEKEKDDSREEDKKENIEKDPESENNNSEETEKEEDTNKDVDGKLEKEPESDANEDVKVPEADFEEDNQEKDEIEDSKELDEEKENGTESSKKDIEEEAAEELELADETVEEIASGSCGTHASWSLDSEGTLVISGYGSMKGYYQSHGPWYDERSNIKKVVIGDGITKIGQYAFKDLSMLSEVEMQDSVDIIEQTAFYNCKMLETVTFSGVSEIGGEAFRKCTKLKQIELPDTLQKIGSYAFGECSALRKIQIPQSVVSIGGGAFSGCTRLTAVGFEASEENMTIGTRAFEDCSSLKEIEIPGQVSEIGIGAFVGCIQLEKVAIASGLQTVKEKAFSGCQNLKEVELPDSLVTLGQSVFANCTKLTQITVPGKVNTIDANAFEKSGLKFVTIESGVYAIGNAAFRNCSDLEEVVVPESVEKIESNSFDKCPKLKFKCEAGTYAEEYAKEKNIPLVGKMELDAASITKMINTVSGIHVYWNVVSGADSYTVYRSDIKNGTYMPISKISRTNYTDTAVESGKTYFYKIQAATGETTAEFSDVKQAIYVSTPDFTLRVNRSTGIGLGWNKITGATGYAIYRKSYSGSDPWIRVATITSGNTVSWTDTGVKSKNGSIYRYTVRALAGSDRKILSGCRNTGRTMVRLMTPVLNSVSAASATSMKAAWGKNSQASGYEVRLMVGGTVYKTYIVGGNANLTKTITGLKKGTTYKVQVRAYKKVDGVGSFYSAWSGAKNVVMK